MDDRGAMETPNGLRVVAFTMRIQGYNLIREWATAGGHTIALIVATPGPSTRRNTLYHDVIAAAPPGQDILVTTRLRRVATPLLRELQPDLIICGGFPYRVLPEIVAIPRYGAVNFHPAPLPAYRGPNPPRMIYDEYPIVGMTLHRVEEEFDTGRILCQKTAPLPVGTTPEEIWGPWFSLVAGTITEGIARAVAGDPGTPQDESKASYAAEFTEAEHWLDWTEPAITLLRKSAVLNGDGPAAKARIVGQDYVIERLVTLPGVSVTDAPGTVLDRDDEGMTIAAGDGAVRVVARPLAG